MSSASIREEDELLRHAYVPSNVTKIYAFRYRGYVDDLPHYFTRDLEDKTLRGRHDHITFRNQGRKAITQLTVECRRGDWIIVDKEGTTCLSDEAFRSTHTSVQDLKY